MQTELHVDDSAIQNWDIFYGTLLMYTDIKDLFLNFKLFAHIAPLGTYFSPTKEKI